MAREFKFFSMRIDAKLCARIKRAAQYERRSASNWASMKLEKAVEESERRKGDK